MTEDKPHAFFAAAAIAANKKASDKSAFAGCFSFRLVYLSRALLAIAASVRLRKLIDRRRAFVNRTLNPRQKIKRHDDGETDG